MKRNWKKSVSVLALVGILTVGAVAASGTARRKIQAELRPDITVKVDGVSQTYGSDQGVIAYNGSTYLPVRAVSDALGADVDWDNKSQTVVLTGRGNNGKIADDDYDDDDYYSYGTGKGNYIGKQKAKEIALKDANVSISEVTFRKVAGDWDDGRLVYDIEFYTSTSKYDYEINATTGAIEERETESWSSASKGTDIGMEKAKKIAVAHAGLTLSQVTFTDAEKDWDDGRLEYELEFYCNGVEYEYTINAADGTILDVDVDRD